MKQMNKVLTVSIVVSFLISSVYLFGQGVPTCFGQPEPSSPPSCGGGANPCVLATYDDCMGVWGRQKKRCCYATLLDCWEGEGRYRCCNNQWVIVCTGEWTGQSACDSKDKCY